MTSFRRKRIGDILIAKKLITQAQISSILPKTDGSRTRLGELLVAEGLVSEEDLAKALAEQRDLPYVDLMSFRVDPKFFETISIDLMRRYLFVPLEDGGDVLIVAMSDPNNLPAIDELEMILNRQIELRVSTPHDIEAVLNRGDSPAPILPETPAANDFPVVKTEDILSFSSFSSAKQPAAKHAHRLQNLVIVGDRILVDPDEGADKTPSGLYLPPTVKEKEKILGGKVVKVGPGYPIPDAISAESWIPGKNTVKYLPLQALEGDYAIFLRESAIEIELEEKKYLIVPHSAILALFRTDLPEEI